MNPVSFKPCQPKPDPLAATIPPRVLRVPLTEEQSRILAAAGRDAFSIISRQSYPGNPDLFVVTIAPLEWSVAVAACGVLLGSHRATRIKTPPAPLNATNSPVPARTP